MEPDRAEEATRYLNLTRNRLRMKVDPARATLADAPAARVVALHPEDPSYCSKRPASGPGRV